MRQRPDSKLRLIGCWLRSGSNKRGLRLFNFSIALMHENTSIGCKLCSSTLDQLNPLKIMKCFLSFLSVTTIILLSCSFQNVDDFEFGTKYNAVRKKMGSPLIKHNMIPQNCCGAWTMYQIDKALVKDKAYHSSKTIRLIVNGKLTEEEDIYRKDVDDTTILQLNILTSWRWEAGKLNMRGNTGKIDKRTIGIKASGFTSEFSKFPNYEFKDLNQLQIDSVLIQWGLSRFDPE